MKTDGKNVMVRWCPRRLPMTIVSECHLMVVVLDLLVVVDSVVDPSSA